MSIIRLLRDINIDTTIVIDMGIDSKVGIGEGINIYHRTLKGIGVIHCRSKYKSKNLYI